MSNKAAATALGPMALAAAEQHLPTAQRLTDDPLAVHFLPAHIRIATRWRPLRALLHTATERQARGMWAAIACRKRYFDERTRAAATTGVEAVVNLGAGLDSRAYRLPELAGIPVFEVDLPENIKAKQRLLKHLPEAVPGTVGLVPLDFERQDLAAELRRRGYRLGSRTLFLWEGVTQYLTEDAVRDTLRFLGQAGPGSQLVFTYVREDFLDGRRSFDAEPLYRAFVRKDRVWHFGLDPERVGDLLAEYGWRVTEQLGAAEHRSRYVDPTGRDLPVSELERCVHAVRTG